MRLKWLLKSKPTAFPDLPQDPPIQVVTLNLPERKTNRAELKLECMVDDTAMPSDMVKDSRHSNNTTTGERTVDKTSLVIQNITKELMEIDGKADNDMTALRDKKDFARSKELLGYRRGLLKALSVLSNHHLNYLDQLIVSDTPSSIVQ